MTPQQEASLQHFNVDDLIMSATAYYLGRTSAMVESHCDAVIAAWPDLSEQTQSFIRRIVDEAFCRHARLAEVRADSSWAGRPLGHDCDQQAWQKVRNLWSEQPKHA